METNKKYLLRFKKQNQQSLDVAFHRVHEEVFAETNCLTCANCCQTTSPIFYQTDIEKIAKFLQMKPGSFIQKYLQEDEDKDLVLKSSPCAFLQDDKHCSIYKHRPKACREYPHTHRKKVIQILDLIYKNRAICPAVSTMIERLKNAIP